MKFLGGWSLALGLAALSASLLIHYAHLHGARRARPHLHLLRRAHLHVGLALLCAIVGGFVAGAFVVTGYVLIRGPHGYLQPPWVAQTPHGAGVKNPHHGLGFVPRKKRQGRPKTFGAYAVPAAVDLSQYAPQPGYQGAVNSCVSWVVGYALRGWYANRDGHYPGGAGFAPMYLYSQVAGGANVGTSFPSNFGVLAQQGIDTAQHYYQGAFDYYNQPTASERANAYQYRALGMQALFVGAGQGAYAQQAIEQALAGGDPVALGIPVYSNMLSASSGSYYITGIAGAYYGAHAVTAVKYDQNGVWVLNQWSSSWGLNGYVELSWPFIQQFALEADTLLMPHRAPPRPTVTSRPRPTARPTPHPRPRPTARPTARPRPPAPPRVYLLMRDQRVRLRPTLYPVQKRVLHRGLLLHGTGQRSGHWIRVWIPRGTSWLLDSNVRHVRAR